MPVQRLPMTRHAIFRPIIERFDVEHAKRMLLSEHSVKSVAYSLGFSSPSSFCFAFRRSTGVTPREFRQRSPSATVNGACPRDEVKT